MLVSHTAVEPAYQRLIYAHPSHANGLIHNLQTVSPPHDSSISLNRLATSGRFAYTFTASFGSSL